jgi:hypothetical protein
VAKLRVPKLSLNPEHYDSHTVIHVVIQL